MNDTPSLATVTVENLYRIFTVAEAPESTLGKVDQEISQNLAGFLREHIVAREKDLDEIERDFSSADIPDQPSFVSSYTDSLLKTLVAQSVHTAAPGFVGHMTSALPYFMLPLSRIMIALNQNLVKIETSKAFTPLERQVLAMLHNLVYQREPGFYATTMHDPNLALGVFCSGGTVSNITALWAARNALFPANGDFGGIQAEGLSRSLEHAGYNGLAVLVSRRGHYSLAKAADVLGFGGRNLVAIDTDEDNRIDIGKLRSACEQLRDRNIKIMAIVGIAGTTETGSIDPLDRLADVAAEYGCHFHVDAAWGGPVLFSETHGSLLKGIERADSVTIDAHKQLYVPMGAGMVVFRDPTLLSSIEHHAQYILREGSKDLGSHTLEGSRPGMAMLVHAGFNIIGRKGYEMLIDRNIKLAGEFARLIEESDDFELVVRPELNILAYRYLPGKIRQQLLAAGPTDRARINAAIDALTQQMQKDQRAAGLSFVSRTRITPRLYRGDTITVLRAVLANPLTTIGTLEAMLEEQRQLVQTPYLSPLFDELQRLSNESALPPIQ